VGWSCGPVRLVQLALCLLTLLVAPARAGEQGGRVTFGGVIDHARLFNAEERRSLEVAAGRIARHANLDMFVVTVDDKSLTWAWRRETSRQVIERVFRDVKGTASRHFGEERPLAVLIVFRHDPVLHLKTDNDTISKALLFNNFYSGAKGAFERVRDPKQDSHHDAAMRNLAAFAARLAKSTPDERIETIRTWLLAHGAYLSSRDLIETVAFEPFYLAFEWSRGHLAALTSLSPTMSLLALFVFWHITLVLLLTILPEAFPETVLPSKGHWSSLAKRALDGLHQALLLPILLTVYSITSADLENLTHMTQLAEHNVAMGSANILAYLDISERILAILPPFSDPIVFAAMALVALITILRLIGFWSMNGIVWTSYQVVGSLVRTPAFVFSLLIFPAVLQAYFVAVALATQALLWLIASRQAVPAQDLDAAAARRSTNTVVKSGTFAGRT